MAERSGSRTGENRPAGYDGYMLYTPVLIQEYIAELEARCVRAEEALRRLREFIKHDCEAARIIDAALSTTPAGCKRVNNPDGLLAAVSEESKPASDFEGADTDCRGHSLDRPT